jgi:cyanophycinase
MAERYLDWLISHGIRAELLPIALHNIERASRDRALLRTLQRVGSLLLTGGDQRRLVEALLHCAEATPVLHTLVTAFERGTPLIAVAASAAALGARMIAEGDSVDALRFGSDEDASTSGVVVERGIGLTRLGLIDQNFVRRRRLGRLLIACVEQRQRFGFGLCEGSGMIVHGNDREIEAIGAPGVVIAETRPRPGAPRARRPGPRGYTPVHSRGGPARHPRTARLGDLRDLPRGGAAAAGSAGRPCPRLPRGAGRARITVRPAALGAVTAGTSGTALIGTVLIARARGSTARPEAHITFW